MNKQVKESADLKFIRASIKDQHARLTEEGKTGHNLQLEFQRAKNITEGLKVLVDARKVEYLNNKLEYDFAKLTNKKLK